MSDNKNEKEPYYAGRPTDYNQECLDLSRKYLNDGWKEGGKVIPSLVGLARYIGRGKTTLYTWKNDSDPKKDAFRDILLKIEELQQEELLNNGLSGQFNSAITKLILTKHGYSDKQEVDQTVKADVKIENYGDAVTQALAAKHKKE